MRDYSRMFTFSLVIFFFISLGFSFYKFYIVRDYLVYGHTKCDPSVNSCFVSECDPESSRCAGNPEEDTEYYALIEKNASQIAVCDPHTEMCDALTCLPNEMDCKVSFCNEENAKKDGVECSNSEDFQSKEPATEEGTDESGVESDDGERSNEPAVIQSGKPGLTEDPLETPTKSQEMPLLPKDKALQ